MILAKVLLTSDDQANVWLWSNVLMQKGLDVEAISSPQDSLDKIAGNGVYDLIVVDEYSAEMDGVELIRQLRAHSAVPILLLVNSHDESKALQAYEAGADECITKPISPRLFMAKIKAWLARSTSVPSQMQPKFQVGEM